MDLYADLPEEKLSTATAVSGAVKKRKREESTPTRTVESIGNSISTKNESTQRSPPPISDNSTSTINTQAALQKIISTLEDNKNKLLKTKKCVQILTKMASAVPACLTTESAPAFLCSLKQLLECDVNIITGKEVRSEVIELFNKVMKFKDVFDSSQLKSLSLFHLQGI